MSKSCCVGGGDEEAVDEALGVSESCCVGGGCARAAVWGEEMRRSTSIGRERGLLPMVAQKIFTMLICPRNLLGMILFQTHNGICH